MSQHRGFYNTHKPKSTHGILGNVLAYVQGASTGTAYDLCCGTGQLTAMLAQRGFAAFGVDVSSRFIGQQGDEATGYIVGDVSALPFPDASAALITCVDSLQYVADPGRVIAEMGRVLRPGGQLILSTQNNTNPAGLKRWLIQRTTGEAWSPWLVHPIENAMSYGQLMRLLEANGFAVRQVRGKQFLTAWVSLLPQGLRHWSPWVDKPWRSLAGLASRAQFPAAIEESPLARYGMIVLVSATKRE